MVFQISVRKELALSRGISSVKCAATNFAVAKLLTELLKYVKLMNINFFNYNIQMINATKPILYF